MVPLFCGRSLIPASASHSTERVDCICRSTFAIHATPKMDGGTKLWLYNTSLTSPQVVNK
eukprot:scaffold10630_cov108-Skeletonema_dohrnii-CCMP3373.AAC.1